MIDQQIFHHLLLIGDGLGGSGMNDHPIAHRRLAGGNELGNPLDFNQTNPAGGGNGKSRVVAVMRQDMPGVQARLEDHLAVFALDEFAVDRDLGHSVADGTRGCEEFH